MPNPNGPSPAVFFELANAYQRSEALKAAVELDLFTHIANGRRSAEEIATACSASLRGVRILADYLVVAGLLRKAEGRYELSQDAKTFLTRTSPAYLGGTLEFLLTPQLRESFANLTQAVKQGRTAMPDDGTVSHDNPVWVAFARAMGPMMMPQAEMLVKLADGDRSRPLRVLDVAAGHGIFGIAFARQFPNARITALDWANVLAVADENAARAGVTDRIAMLPGSAFEVDWGGPYDVVLLTNILHHFDTEACEGLAKKSFAALAPGGRAITLEFIPDADRVSPPPAAGFALTMLATTAAGDAYTFAEYEQMFSHAGFTRSTFHPLPPTPQQAIVSFKS